MFSSHNIGLYTFSLTLLKFLHCLPGNLNLNLNLSVIDR